ncbi:MAG: type III glutamate--ammonia ligase, partial [Acidiferrobacterales bacterium]
MAKPSTLLTTANREGKAYESEESLRDKGVRYCLASYVDVHGIPKAKTVPVHHFDRMMRGSELFTGAALDGLGQGPQDDELAIHPDQAAVTILPWRAEVAWAPGNLKYHNEPWPMCSRTVLCRQLERAAQMGFRFNLGVECEIFLVRREDDQVFPANPKDVLAKAAYDVVGLLENLDWLDEMARHMDQLGWAVHSFDHEDANSQFEFDFAYADALTMADRYVLWRLMAKELARRRGFEATFMPKPYSDRTGSGAHFNMSLASVETGENLFDDPSDKRNCRLSKLGYQFMAGVLQHAPAVVATTCPSVNSYKRLVKTGSMTGYTWAPIFISYGGNNRTHMLRVPKVRPEIEGGAPHEDEVYLSSTRIESRAVDSSMNPYLGAAMMLAAGLDGIERDLDPGDPIDVNMYEMNDRELKRRKVKLLPRTLLEAIEAFAKDP